MGSYKPLTTFETQKDITPERLNALVDEIRNATSKLGGSIASNAIAIDSLSSSSSSSSASTTFDNYAVYQDSKATGSGGGAATGAAWTTRTLNNTQGSAGSYISRSGNTITLGIGVYLVYALVPASKVGKHLARLATTGGTATIIGTAEYSSTDQTWSKIVGIINVTSSTDYEIQHYPETSNANTSALGVPSNVASHNEKYTTVFILKIG